MKNRTLLLTFLMVIGLSYGAFSQKIGYANMEIILAYMPETKSMTQTLQTYQTQLSKKLEVKRDYAQQKLAEAQQKAQEGATDEQLKPYQDELQKLDQEIQKEATDADQKLMLKRQDLMQPITEKLQKAIKDTASEEGYEYVLNSVDGSGVSIVLHGPEGNDLTKKIMMKLGIQIPEDSGN